MSRYLSITKGSFMATTTYMYSMVFTFIGNIAFIIILYFLWQAIFGESETLRGMTFNQAFVYLAVGSSTINLFRTWVEWFIAETIREGAIVIDLIRPLDYQLMMFSRSLGQMFFQTLIIWIPSLVVVFGVFGASVPMGINLPLFLVSMVLAYILCFIIDYSVGITAFYTESIWGLSISKDVVVAFLAGTLIPLQFFPDGMREAVELLPFQAVYHLPLQILTNPDMGLREYAEAILLQGFWVMILGVLSRLFYRQAIKTVTINGG